MMQIQIKSAETAKFQTPPATFPYKKAQYNLHKAKEIQIWHQFIYKSELTIVLTALVNLRIKTNIKIIG